MNHPSLASLTELFTWVTHVGGPARGQHAEAIIDARLRAASVRQIVALAGAARASFRATVGGVAIGERSLPVSLTSFLRIHGVAVACLLSLHRNGYIREAAVLELGQRRDALVVPFLLLRSDDIVESIRERASAQLESMVRPEDAATFARALALVELLRKRKRGARIGIVAKLEQLFRDGDPRCRDALAHACSDVDPAVRGHAFALRLTADAPTTVLFAALRDRDTRVRWWAARAAVEHPMPDADRLALLPSLESSGTSNVRRLALIMRGKLGDDEALEAALLDANAAVRLTARLLLRERHPDRPFGATRALALARLGKVDASAAAITGALGALADVGLPADADVVAPFASDARSRIRREAERTLATLGYPMPQG